MRIHNTAVLQPVHPARSLLDSPTTCYAVHIEKQTIFARPSVQTRKECSGGWNDRTCRGGGLGCRMAVLLEVQI